MRDSRRRSFGFFIFLAPLAAGIQFAHAAFSINIAQSGCNVIAIGGRALNQPL